MEKSTLKIVLKMLQNFCDWYCSHSYCLSYCPVDDVKSILQQVLIEKEKESGKK